MLARVTIAIGALLTIGGLWGYFGTGMKSITPLAPALPALIILVCGLVALNKAKASSWLMGAQLVAFITLVFCIPNVLKTPQLLDGSAERPSAVALSLVFAALLTIYLAISIPSTLKRPQPPARAS